jgi:5-formyltetrahydrofolate cyclo-ligase
MSPVLSKNDLRTAALARRNALTLEQRGAAAQMIASREFPISIWSGAVVAGYSPIRSELDPTPLMEKLGTGGAQLALPVIVARDQPLLFRAWNSGDALAHDQLGILEPSASAPELQPDIVLVPLAAFDGKGHRIGYGAGHYDRTFARLRAVKRIIAIGLAFAVQEIEIVPALPHDVGLDYVLTEDRTYDFRSL